MRHKKPTYKKHQVCENCSPEWDRKGGVRRIVLCPLHEATTDLLAALMRLRGILEEGAVQQVAREHDWGTEYDWNYAIDEAKAAIAQAEGKRP